MSDETRQTLREHECEIDGHSFGTIETHDGCRVCDRCGFEEQIPWRDEMDEEDCMDCGMCEQCVDRSIAAAETDPTRERIEEAQRNCGILINMNNGQCYEAEKMLLQIMGVLHECLASRV